MLNTTRGIQAYKAVSRHRSQRILEADIFRYANVGLNGAKCANPVQQVRALADNRRLWITIDNLLRDPNNVLPQPLKAGILSIGMTIQKEMKEEVPDLDFLISINESIVDGLTLYD